MVGWRCDLTNTAIITSTPAGRMPSLTTNGTCLRLKYDVDESADFVRVAHLNGNLNALQHGVNASTGISNLDPTIKYQQSHHELQYK